MRRPLVVIIIIVTISLILYLTHRYLALTNHQCYVSGAIWSKQKFSCDDILTFSHIFAFMFLRKRPFVRMCYSLCHVTNERNRNWIQSEFIRNYLSNSNERMKINSVFIYIDINKTLSCHNAHRHSFRIHYLHPNLLRNIIWDWYKRCQRNFCNQNLSV